MSIEEFRTASIEKNIIAIIATITLTGLRKAAIINRII
jgi:hypothetical protein